MIVYLHGFCSSPASHKAQQLKAHMAARGLGGEFWCEQLPVSPRAAVALVEGTLQRSSARVTLVGSSLGGFYATYLAEKHGLSVALINPAILPHTSLKALVGPQQNFHTGERFEFTPAHAVELKALDVPCISCPERYLLLVETGDEVLDYRQAVARYAGARQIVIEGGDHGFQHFGEHMDTILRFAGLIP